MAPSQASLTAVPSDTAAAELAAARRVLTAASEALAGLA